MLNFHVFMDDFYVNGESYAARIHFKKSSYFQFVFSVTACSGTICSFPPAFRYRQFKVNRVQDGCCRHRLGLRWLQQMSALYSESTACLPVLQLKAWLVERVANDQDCIICDLQVQHTLLSEFSLMPWGKILLLIADHFIRPNFLPSVCFGGPIQSRY